jgi:hypothetical protein
MKEELLHYVWRTQRFDLKALKTTTGELIEILHAGHHNQNAGPDFLNAKLKIGETFWAGNIEMHLLASDWYKHKHEKDRAYESVILHVVLEEDQPVHHPKGSRIPCLELNRRLPPQLVNTYQKLIRNQSWIPCQHQFSEVSDIHKNIWLEQLLIERLMQKTERIEKTLENNLCDWEGTFYQFLARSFGLHVNALPFQMLAQSVPLLILLKHKNSLFQIEAYLFGQAGFLQDDFKDEYPLKLKKEYLFLKEKYGLKSLPVSAWKFSRLRPANFPTIRIAQLAQLIYQTDSLFGKALAANNINELENMFALKLSNYWQEHYQFDKPSPKKQKPLGKASVHLFIINTIVPFLFLYGNRKQEETHKAKALQLLQELKPERNSTTNHWQKLGFQAESASQTQGLLQLKHQYCEQFKCLECSIGHAILSG